MCVLKVDDQSVAVGGCAGGGPFPTADDDRRLEGADIGRSRDDLRHRLRRIVDGEGDDPANVIHRVKRHAVNLARPLVISQAVPSDRVALDGGIEDILARREPLDDRELRTTDDHGVTAGPGVDDDVAHRPHVGAVEIDRVVAAAGEHLEPFDVDKRLQLDPRSVDPLHRLPGDDRGVDIKRVGEHRADDGH